MNSTMEKLSLIRMLKDHESARRSSEHEVEKAWMNRVDVSDTWYHEVAQGFSSELIA